MAGIISPMELSSLTCGQNAEIVGYHPGNAAYRRQLLAMGLTPGTHFTLLRIAPLGDPVEICIRGYHVTLRRAEAAILRLKATTAVCADPSHNHGHHRAQPQSEKPL